MFSLPFLMLPLHWWNFGTFYALSYSAVTSVTPPLSIEGFKDGDIQNGPTSQLINIEVEKGVKEEGYSAGGSHHGSSTVGLSGSRHLLRIRAHFIVQDREMRVPQGRLHLRVMLMYGAVYQQHTPEPTGRVANDASYTQRGYRDREGKGAARSYQGGKDMDARGRWW